MDRLYLNSSNLRSVGYDERTQTLEVEFTNGSIYQYFNVPRWVYLGLVEASSHGSYFDTHVKKAGYTFIQIA